MNRIRTTFLVSVGLLFSFTGSTFARDNACLMEGVSSFDFEEKKINIEDCYQNNGVTRAQLKETCSGLTQVKTGMFSEPPTKITYLAACPSQSQGSCESIYGQPATRYHLSIMPGSYLGQRSLANLMVASGNEPRTAIVAITSWTSKL